MSSTISGQVPDEPGTTVSTERGVTTSVTLGQDGSVEVSQNAGTVPAGTEVVGLVVDSL